MLVVTGAANCLECEFVLVISAATLIRALKDHFWQCRYHIGIVFNDGIIFLK